MKSIEITNEVKVTAEEKQIVSRLAMGDQGDEIRRHIRMAPGTFANLLKDMRLKYGCRNTTHLVAFFLRNNLID